MHACSCSESWERCLLVVLACDCSRDTGSTRSARGPMWRVITLLCAACGVRAETPRRIIQTSSASAVREDWIRWTAILADTNPEFEMLMFDDDAALAFVDKHYAGTELPHAYRYFASKRIVMATDLFRLAVVGAIGGFCVYRCIAKERY